MSGRISKRQGPFGIDGKRSNINHNPQIVTPKALPKDIRSHLKTTKIPGIDAAHDPKVPRPKRMDTRMTMGSHLETTELPN